MSDWFYWKLLLKYINNLVNGYIPVWMEEYEDTALFAVYITSSDEGVDDEILTFVPLSETIQLEIMNHYMNYYPKELQKEGHIYFVRTSRY